MKSPRDVAAGLKARATFATLAVLTGLTVAGCRQDMHDAPRIEPFEANAFFPDQRGSRVPPQGTVARGWLRDDEALYTGKIDGQLVDTIPFAISHDDLKRGQQRFNIYCSPCHGRTGDGDGMVVQRGYRRPPSYHQDRLRTAPVGHFFDVMTNGFGAMPDYAVQVTAEDRWAIAAYIRALQLASHATPADVPAANRGQLDAR
jgi:mono/diheme cytochrome c family protein